MNIGKTDICDHIGAFAVHWTCTEIRGLYFDPNEFPLPIDIDSGGVNETFRRLKTYMKAVSDAGSRIRYNKAFYLQKEQIWPKKVVPILFSIELG